MHKANIRVSVTVSEIFQMKTDSRMFAKFVTLSKDWINASAFSMARRTRADLSECRTWLTAGLWDAVCRVDDRARSIGIVYDLAVRYAANAHHAQYINVAAKVEDACDSCHRGDDGEMEDILIPDEDENIRDLPFRQFMDILSTQMTERDFLVVREKLNGRTLEEIGELIGTSKQYAAMIFKKHIPKMRAYV